MRIKFSPKVVLYTQINTACIILFCEEQTFIQYQISKEKALTKRTHRHAGSLIQTLGENF